MLDVSEYQAEHIEVLGLPLDKVRWNSKRHALVDASWTGRREWGEVHLDDKSFWRMCLFRLRTFGVSRGIFGLPLEKSNYRNFEEEREQLSRLGFLDGQ